MADKLSITLQENLATLLAHSDEHGKVVAQLCDPTEFEGELRIICERCINYWNKHDEAPKSHTADLVADILEDATNRRAQTFSKLLLMLHEYIPHVNDKYVLDQLRTHTRMHKIKATIIASATRIQNEQELAITDIEQMWRDILHTRDVGLDLGIGLTDIDVLLKYQEQRTAEYITGIDELDKRAIVPARQTIMLFLAPTGFGKTWYLVNVGKQALMRRQKVLHISLEMSREQVLQRYYQCLFSVPRRPVKDLWSSHVNINDKRQIELTQEAESYEFHLHGDLIADELDARINWMGTRSRNLRIMSFPPRMMTIAMLEAHIDLLQSSDGFIPDLLVLDSPYLLHTDAKNYRISLGRTFEEVRALAVSRNIAVVGAHQISRLGSTKAMVQATHVAEDFSVIATSDIVLTYSSSEFERNCKLARIYVSKARDEQDKFTVLITQNYPIGQFASESHLLPENYFGWLQEEEAKQQKQEEDDDDDADAESD